MAKRWPHLEKAPIQEALIDLRAVLPSDAQLETLQRFRDAISGEYPTSKDHLSFSAQLQLEAGKGMSVGEQSGGIDGYMCLSPDGLRVAQGRLDGFTFSRLRPYGCWDDLKREARTAWTRYAEVVKPVSITRIAVRYVNRVELPGDGHDPRKWSLSAPAISPWLPQTPLEFVTRVVLPFPEDVRSVVTQIMAPMAPANTLGFVLDIDVFQEGSSVPQAEEALWSRLEDLRDIKNHVFFSSLPYLTLREFE